MDFLFLQSIANMETCKTQFGLAQSSWDLLCGPELR